MRFLLQKWGSSDKKYFPLHQEIKVNILFFQFASKQQYQQQTILCKRTPCAKVLSYRH